MTNAVYFGDSGVRRRSRGIGLVTVAEPRSIRCSAHGLVYDPSTASGCIRCRKSQAAGPALCVDHADAPAAGQCSACLRLWCEGCIRQLKAGTGFVAACPACDGPVAPPAKLMATGVVDLADLLSRPFSKEGVVAAAAVASASWVSSLLSQLPGVGVLATLFWLVYLAALVGYYFRIIDHIGQDRPGLPGPADSGDDMPSIFTEVGRGLVCLLVGTAPLLVWMYGLRDREVPLSLYDHGLTVIGLVLIGMCYMPAALLSIVLTHSTLGALYPVAWIQIIARAPGSYLKLVGLFILSALAYLVGSQLALAVGLWIPIVGTWIASTVSAILIFAQAALVGGFLRRNAAAFGWD